MIFGIVCLVISVMALVFAIINGRAVDSSFELPMLATFAITIVAGILAIVFNSWVVGVIVIVLLTCWLSNSIWP